MDDAPLSSASTVVDRLMAATNAHDVDALVACFAPDYVLTDPAHPARGFTGAEQVRRNWTAIFAGVPDLRCTVLARAESAGDAGVTNVWVEMAMTGMRRDGAPHELAGVMVFGVRDDAIVTGRFFLQQVDHAGGDADAAVRSTLAAQVP
jgi:ketosteroid isomerase-like protein